MKKYLIPVAVVISIFFAAIYFSAFHLKKINNETNSDKKSADLAISSSIQNAEKRKFDSGDANQIKASRPTEYYLKFESIKHKATEGDPKAQFELSKIYDRCFPVSVSSTKFLSGIKAMAAQAGNAASAMNATAKRIADDCALIEGGSIIPLEAQKEWLKAAAASGDISAKIKLRNIYPAESKENISELINESIKNKDPEAIFELRELLSQPQESDLGEFEPVSGDAISAYAWGIVACQMGAECGAESAIVDGYCLNGACGSNYEQLVRNYLLPNGATNKINEKIDYINRMIR
jgi:hypothetical protein